jgi:hypothetical protein
MNDEPIDLSLLDPTRDRQRWQARIDRIVTDTLRARQHVRVGLFDLVERFGRPALAIAATIALVSWAGTLQFGKKPAAGAQGSPTNTLLTWATNDEVPSTSEVFESLGVQNVRH